MAEEMIDLVRAADAYARLFETEEQQAEAARALLAIRDAWLTTEVSLCEVGVRASFHEKENDHVHGAV